jgi:hypothetical protein
MRRAEDKLQYRLMGSIRAVAALGLAGVPVLLAGSAPNLLTITPGIQQFEATGVGSTSTLYSTPSIYNPGATAVTITGFTLAGPQSSDFSITSNNCPLSPSALAPGQYCYINISFTPSAVGLRLATLVVKDVGGATQTVLLTGEGLAATTTVTFATPEVTFPSTPVGLPPQNAPEGFVEAQNTGNVAVNVSSVSIVGADSQDFSIVFNNCSPSISAGGFCEIILSFLPTATGLRSASLQLVDNAQGGVQSVPLVGAGSPAVNMLQFFPAAVAFSPVGTSVGEPGQITVENTGSEPVTINGFLVTGQNATDFLLLENYCQPIPYILGPQEQCDLEMLFTPGAVGTRLANLVIVDSAPGSPQTVAMEGAGLSSTVGSLSFTYSPAQFGLITLGQQSLDYLYLQNTGTAEAQVSLQIQGIDAADFSETGNCSFIFGQSECFIPVYFTPSALGIRVATLVATDSVSGQSLSVVLIGSGVASALPVSVSTPSFSSVAVGNTTEGYFSFTNVSQSALTVTQFALKGGAQSDFGILLNNCGVGTVLNPFDGCSATITFTPSAAGTRVAEIDIGYSGGSSALSVPLAAVGLAPSRAITFESSGLELGAELLGQAVAGSVSINNTGSEPVSFAGVSIAGPAAQDFAIILNQCPQRPASLAPGSNCEMSVQFTPSALGPRLARLQLADNAAGSPQSLPLAGFGVNGAPAIQIEPDAVSFVSEPLGSSTQYDVSLDPVSGAAVTLSSLQIVGPNAGDFTLVNDCPPILTTYCDVDITFTPSVTGLRVAELQISDNATGSPQTIPLAGLGLAVPPPAGAISLTPNPVVFTQVQGIGYSTSITFNVTNTGTAGVLLTGFQIGGRAAKDFGIEGNNCPLSPAPLGPNQSCGITIEFTPSATGVRLATFTLTDNATGSPQSVSIVGEGAAAVKTLQATPSSLTFAPTPVGSTDFDGGIVNIENTGTVPVTFKNFGFAGADPGDFSVGVDFCGLTLNPGFYCQIYLNFTPAETGARSAEFNIESDATPGKQTVQLTGTGQ